MQENFSPESSTEIFSSNRENQDTHEYLDFLQDFKSEDTNNIIKDLSENNPTFGENFQNFQNDNWNKLLEQLSNGLNSEEVLKNDEFLEQFETYSKISNSIFAGLESIQKNMNESTSLSSKFVDEFVWLFTDETTFDTYQSWFTILLEQSENVLNRLNEIDESELSTENKSKLINLKAELQEINKLQLESTGFIQMTQNDIYAIPQNIENSIYGAKGIIEWTIDGWIAMITGSIDLLIFLWKYPFSTEYREWINKQAEAIYDYLELNWLQWLSNDVFKALDSEMLKIQTLPQEQQAEAIWKIAWNIISMLAVTKAWITVWEKLWKITQTEQIIAKAEIAGNIAKAKKIQDISSTLLHSKKGLQAFDILLSWVAESVLMKWIWKSYKILHAALSDVSLWSTQKIQLINSEISSIAILEWNNSEILIKTKYLDELIKSKQEFFNKLSRSEVWDLDDKLRLEYWEYLLERKLSPAQQKAIIDSHETWIANIDWKYSVWDLRKKYIILKENWFNRDEIELLFEKKVCGRNESIDKNKVDITELKWTYAFDSIQWLNPLEANKRMERFTSAIDVKYLVNNPKRMDLTLDIIESMSRYIENNAHEISRLSPRELTDFKYVFWEMKLQVDTLWKSKLLTQFKWDLLETRWIIRNALIALNPNLRPKK